MVNKWIGVGRCGKDPETRYLADGTAVTNWTLACSEKYKTKSGEQREETFWAKCSAFGRLAEIVSKYAQKGTLMYCEGKLQERSWEDKDGVKRYSTDVKVSEMKLLSPRGERGGSQDTGGPDMGADVSF